MNSSALFSNTITNVPLDNIDTNINNVHLNQVDTNITNVEFDEGNTDINSVQLDQGDKNIDNVQLDQVDTNINDNPLDAINTKDVCVVSEIVEDDVINDNVELNNGTSTPEDKIFDDTLSSLSHFEAKKENKESESTSSSSDDEQKTPKEILDLNPNVNPVSQSESISSLLNNEDFKNICDSNVESQNLENDLNKSCDLSFETDQSTKTNEDIDGDDQSLKENNCSEVVSQTNSEVLNALQFEVCSDKKMSPKSDNKDILEEALQKLGNEVQGDDDTDSCISGPKSDSPSEGDTKNPSLVNPTKDSSENLNSDELIDHPKIFIDSEIQKDETNLIESNELAKIELVQPNKGSSEVDFLQVDKVNEECTEDDTSAKHDPLTKPEVEVKIQSLDVEATKSISEIGSEKENISFFDIQNGIMDEAISKLDNTEAKFTASQEEVKESINVVEEFAKATEAIFLVDSSSLSDSDASKNCYSSPPPKFRLKQCKVNLVNCCVNDRSKEDIIASKPNFNKLKRKLEEMLQTAQKEEVRSMKQLKKMKDEKSAMLQDIVKEIQKIKRKFKV